MYIFPFYKMQDREMSDQNWKPENTGQEFSESAEPDKGGPENVWLENAGPNRQG